MGMDLAANEGRWEDMDWISHIIDGMYLIGGAGFAISVLGKGFRKSPIMRHYLPIVGDRQPVLGPIG
ncbi:hypothetical protein GCM10009800_12110 [Nocardiopsis rhodophaea]